MSEQLETHHTSSLVIYGLSAVCKEDRDDCVFTGSNFLREQCAISFLGMLHQRDVAMHSDLNAKKFEIDSTSDELVSYLRFTIMASAACSGGLLYARQRWGRHLDIA